MIVILLTACINPDGMPFTALTNQQERERQYLDAIRYYLSTTKLNIIFVENSGTDISHLFKAYIETGRLECLTFPGNQNKSRGKGYGECEIIEYALINSRLLQSDRNNRIVKITGRLIVKNLKTIIRIHDLLLSRKTVLFAINSDMSFPDSRCIIAPIGFYKKFLKMKEIINDSTGYYFEHALLETIKTEKEYSYSPFFIQPDIVGISGSTGKIFKSVSHSITHMYKYAKYVISLRSKFATKYRTK